MKSYEKWIIETSEALREAIREAENEEWHHHPESDSERAGNRFYYRLLTWSTEIEERRKRIDDSHERGTKTNPLA